MATNAIECVFEYKYEKEKGSDTLQHFMKMNLPEGITPQDVTYTCEFLAMAKQYEVYLRYISYIIIIIISYMYAHKYKFLFELLEK